MGDLKLFILHVVVVIQFDGGLAGLWIIRTASNKLTLIFFGKGNKLCRFVLREESLRNSMSCKNEGEVLTKAGVVVFSLLFLDTWNSRIIVYITRR